MSMRRDSCEVTLPAPPSGARIIEGSLAEHDARLRAAQQEAATAAAENAARLFEAACASLEEARQQALDSVAENAVALALGITRELLRVEISGGNYDIAAITRETLAATSGSSGLTEIHVNPNDAAQLERMPLRSGTTVKADPAVRTADVHVRTDQGLLVREIDACVRAIGERLRGEVE